MSNSSIWPIDRALSGATTLGQSGPGSDGNEGVLCIPQSSSITEASPSDCLASYTGFQLGVVLPLCRDAIGVFYSRLGQVRKEYKTRHDWVRKVTHWELCKKFKFDHTNKWYMHNQESVLENETQSSLKFWDTNRSPISAKWQPSDSQQKKTKKKTRESGE